MRWRANFVAEVSRSLRQLGLQDCPVCGLSDSLDVGPLPVLVIDGGFSFSDEHPVQEDSDDELTFAVRVECAACGYLMLFNAERFRNGDEKIIALAADESLLEELLLKCHPQAVVQPGRRIAEWPAGLPRLAC